MPRSRSLLALVASLSVAAPTIASGQSVTGVLFEDVNRDGVLDPGEPRLSGIDVGLFGNNAFVDLSQLTGADGSFVFAPAGSASYALEVNAPPDLRMSMLDLRGDPNPIPDFPRGRRRPGVLGNLAENLRASTPSLPLVHVGLGDSIAFGFNICGSLGGANGYLEPFTTRLSTVGGGAALQKLAVLGYETTDLLVPGGSGSIFDAIGRNPDLVTISIGGNDYLANDGNEAMTASNLVAARRNLQEILSTLTTRLPQADILINTVYDNIPGTNAFHNRWGPIWNQMIRDLAFGQVQRVGVAEIWPDYAHLDPWTMTVVGHANLICHDIFGLDDIHPTNTGYTLHREKVWQGAGGVMLSAAGTEDVRVGFQRRIETRAPTAFLDVFGGVSLDGQAFADDGIGALVPSGTQELRLSGFDATPRGLLQQVVVTVKYRTTAAPVDDGYRLEASVDGTFAPAGSTSSTWNTIVPIVGGAASGGNPVNAFPDQPGYRVVSTLVTKGSPTDGTPSLTWGDLANLTVRARGVPTGGADPFSVEWDAAWIDVYGTPPYTLLVRGTGAQGTPLRFDTTGTEGAMVFLFLSGGTASIPFSPFGTLLVDPASLIIVPVANVGPTGASTFSPVVPMNPGLSGLTAHFQSLVVDDPVLLRGQVTNRASVTFP